jgi:hypothetical protein
MNCKKAEKYLPLYPDEIEPGIKEAIDIHLAKCESCRALYASLNLYRAYAVTVPEIEAPGNFEHDVIALLGLEKKAAGINLFYRRTLIITASAAALAILFLIVNPFSKPWDTATETSFVPGLEKKGKGPAPVVDMNMTKKIMAELMDETGATIKKKKENSLTGYYDYIIAGVPAENLDSFIDKFNEVSSNFIRHGEIEKEVMAYSYFKIYFDVINFTAANIDGDNRADMLVQFLSGRNKGRWVVYLHDETERFTTCRFLNLGSKESKYLGDYRIVAGDFNGDGLDDICLYANDEGRNIKNNILLNRNNFKFEEADQNMLSSVIPKPGQGEFFDLLAGDTDGDRKDELILVSGMGEDVYEFRCPEGLVEPQLLFIPDMNTCEGTMLAGDINGDQFVDLCVKYIRGDRGGQTWIYENSACAFSKEPYSMGLSFQGDYIFRMADDNGDGYDDLFVKSSGPFLSGDWYIMKNSGAAKFIFGNKFELEFPEE